MNKTAKQCEICHNKFHGTYTTECGGKILLCCKHLHQMNRHGKILVRTKKDPNKAINCGDYYELCLYSGRGEQKEVARTKIDKEYLEKTKEYKWCASLKGSCYYVKTDIREGNKRSTLYLVNLILGTKKGYQIDHINGDTLDNRKSNLRFCTQQQNLMNKTKALGVSWNKANQQWEAYIGVNNKRK